METISESRVQDFVYKSTEYNSSPYRLRGRICLIWLSLSNIAGQPARDEAKPAAAERADHAARVLRHGVGARPRPVGRHTPSQVRIDVITFISCNM